MAETEYLYLMTLSEDGLSSEPFLDRLGSPVVLRSYTYQAQRMGSATIEATLRTDGCLDGLWTGREYADFRGSRFFLVRTPSSSKDNSDARYTHKLSFGSMRDLLLANTYFYDTIGREDVTGERYVSNGTAFRSFCGLRAFCERFNASLRYRGVKDSVRVSVDEGVADEEKFISFDDKTLFEALQEAYNVWKVPFYFVGDECRFGMPERTGDLGLVMEYGHDAELLGLSRENSGDTAVNHCAGHGSEDNIPYWYPNRTPKGTLEAAYSPKRAGGRSAVVSVDDQLLFCDRVDLNGGLTYKSDEIVLSDITLDGQPIPEGGLTLGGEAYRDYNGDEKLYSVWKDRPNVVMAHHCELTFRLDNRSGKDTSSNVTFVLKGTGRAKRRPDSPYDTSDLLPCCTPLDHAWSYKPGETRTNEVNKKYIEIHDPRVYVTSSDGTERQMELPSVPNTWLRTAYTPSRNGLIYHYDSFTSFISFSSYNGVPMTLSIPMPADESCTVRLSFWLRLGETLWCVGGTRPISDKTDLLWYPVAADLTVDADVSIAESKPYWETDDEGFVLDLKDVGLSLSPASFRPSNGDRITQSVVEGSLIRESRYLLPPIYRNTLGRERFYRASNWEYTVKDVFDRPVSVGPFLIPGTDDQYVFPNPYTQERPREYIGEYEDIKPSIKEARNASDFRIDQIADIYFEPGYDPSKVKEGTEDELEYPYFFVKLRPTDGPEGFNLFRCSIEEDPMTICMTSGNCGSCEFEIAVTEKFQWNPVKTRIVNGSRELLLDEDGRVVFADNDESNIKDTDLDEDQQDSSNPYGVWLALRLDQNTYGGSEDVNGIMPGTRPGMRPAVGDTFVILHIHLPEGYIRAAERRLEEEIIRHMFEHNADTFKFTGIKPSRIWLSEHPDIRESLSEHSALRVSYDGRTSGLMYATSFTYKADEKSVLPEISFEVTDNIEQTESGIQRKIDGIKDDLYAVIVRSTAEERLDGRYVRKDTDDSVDGTLSFRRGFLLGDGGSGASVSETGDATMTVDVLNVRKRASFAELEIRRLEHSGGSVVLSPASGVISSVERDGDSFVCALQTSDGESSVENLLREGDLVMCRVFGGSDLRYYWRLVTASDGDTVRLSVSVCDEGSDEPMEGDTIVQFGNISDPARQSVQVLSTVGEDSPSYIVYKGVGKALEDGSPDWSLEDKRIAGVIYDPEAEEPHVFCHGSAFIGDEASYIAFRKEEGDREKRMHIAADVTIGKGSTGIREFEDYEDIMDDIEVGGVNLLPGTDGGLGWALSEGSSCVGASFFVESPGASAQSPQLSLTRGRYILSMDISCDTESDSALSVSVGDYGARVFRSEDHYGLPRRVKVAFDVVIEDVCELELATLLEVGTWTVSDIQLEKGNVASGYAKSPSDLDYLSKALLSGSETEMRGGVVLSDILGVKDSSTGKVRAMLNGSEIGKDAVHGKMLLGAGARDAADMDNARTKIYEDGHLESTSGKIGGFSIGANFLEARDAATGNYTHFAAELVHMGGDNEDGDSDVVLSNVEWADGLTAGYIRVRNKRVSPLSKATALELSAEGASENIALRMTKGMTQGYRPMTRVVTGSGDILATDTAVVAKGAGTLTLPASHEKGQVFRVYKAFMGGTLQVTTSEDRTDIGGAFSVIPSNTQSLCEYLWTGYEWIGTRIN